jgi:hypothetical protein
MGPWWPSGSMPFLGGHQVGVVTEYTPGASISILDNHGETQTFALSDQTKILPQEWAGELVLGSKVTIVARRDPTGGAATANAIVVHPAETTATTGEQIL